MSKNEGWYNQFGNGQITIMEFGKGIGLIT